MKFFGKKISGPFTIPSGIVTTHASVIEKVANEIPEIGVITTKSISPYPKEGNREPIFTQYAPGCFMNAVGLTNPGVDVFIEDLKKIKIPEDKFLLVSIFGKDDKEFVEAATKIEKYCDGLELNLSCPHAKGYGMCIGQDPVTVKTIVKAVKEAVNIPVIAKLNSSVPNIGLIAKAADITIKGLTPTIIKLRIEQLIKDKKMTQGGIGIYRSFVHYDIRGSIARW